MGYNSNNYPKILTDTDKNFPSSTGMVKSLSVEEYNDLMHHSHEEFKKINAILAALEKAGINVDLDPDTEGVQNPDGTTTFKIASISEISNLDNLTPGDTIKLDCDIATTDSAITLQGVEITLDLNNNTLTTGSSKNNNLVVSNGAKVTIKGGTVVTNDPYDSTHSTTLITVDAGGELEIDGLEVSAVMDDAVNKGQFGIGCYSTGKLTIKDADITAGWYAITGNGNYKDPNNNSEIIIDGGKLTSTTDFAIYHPHAGKLIINGGEITGGTGALSMNNGSCVINGGTLKTTGDGDTGNWSDGTSGQSPAVINLNGKYGPVICEINGGVFIALNNAPIVITGTKYSVTVIIKGGKFSTKPNAEWIAEGYACTEEPVNGLYEVYKA